ncbi:MAG: hypothetical protein ACP5GX_10130 [Anaerolineae bacterium]
MNKQESIEYLTGFIMGAILGMVLNCVGIELYRWVYAWMGRPPPDPTWWSMIPLPLLLGVGMAIQIAHLRLGD